MTDARTNRHLYLAREKLRRLPERAVEQRWETAEPLLAETLTAIAHTLQAQAEISQETLWEIRKLTGRVEKIEARTLHQVTVSYDDIRGYAERKVEEALASRMGEQTGFVEQLVRSLFEKLGKK